MQLFIIITDARHGSTTLCSYIHNLKNVTCAWELLAPRTKTHQPFGSCELNNEEIIQHIEDKLKVSNYCFKVFHNHSNLYFLEKIYQKFKPKIIFLTRKLSDSYESYVKALTTGDWNTNRTTINSKYNGYTKELDEIYSYKEYIYNISKFYQSNKELCLKLNLPQMNITFEDVCNKNFESLDLFFKHHPST